MRRHVFVFVLSLLLVSAAQAQNNRSAVSLSGNDAATCTVPDPCRTFGVAISRSNAGAEVIVLSSGGYGPFTVTKSISIISPLAFHAAMAPSAGTAITVNAPAGSVVVLRGLYLNSLGASTGISVQSPAIVHIENVVVNGFGLNGIEVVGALGVNAEVFIKDSIVRDNSASGIFAGPTSGSVNLTVDHTRLERNEFGIVVDSGVRLTARDTVAARNLSQNFWFRSQGTLARALATVENSTATDGQDGFLAQSGARVTIRNSAASRNGDSGFHASAAREATTTDITEMVIENSLASENVNGILSGLGFGQGRITVSHSTVTGNSDNGIVAGTQGTVRAFGNTVTRNGVGLNGVNGTFRSGGHNFVDGNTTEASGIIITVPTM